MAFSTKASPFDSIIFGEFGRQPCNPSTTGIGDSVKKNIELFLSRNAVSHTPKPPLFELNSSEPTEALSLALGYDITAEDYHSFVHGRLPYDLIKPDFQLRKLLRTIKQRKIIFTNSDRIHALRALDRLGIKDCFEQIICFETINPDLPYSTRPDEFPVLLKPSLDAFKIAIHAGNVDPRRTLFLDDSVRNIAAGKEMGLYTVLVGKTVKSKGADYAVESVHSVAEVIPEIWANGMDGDDERLTRTKSELDAVFNTAAVVGA
ncbi:Pyrimidine 5-nucleotidase [Sesbania bispinosa]|nr:Pyrimidine 5-nucleotidase [Sesbania bispinosa]